MSNQPSIPSFLHHSTRMTLLVAAFVLPAACAVDTSSATRAIIDTPCAEDADCASGFQCEIEVEHGTTTSFCQAEEDGADCPAGYELEVEHDQAFCKPHGGDGDADDSGPDDSDADDSDADDSDADDSSGTDDPAGDDSSARLAPPALGSTPPFADVQLNAGDVRGTASCTPGVKAKIKAGPRDPGKIKTNVQIDDVAVGIVWKIRVIDATEAVVRTRTTAGVSAAINLDTFTTNNPGVDKVRFRAHRADNSAICSGVVVVP